MTTAENLLTLLLLAPAIGALLTWFSKQISENAPQFIATLVAFSSFVIALALFRMMPETGIKAELFTWIKTSSLEIPFALELTPLSMVFALVITGVGSLIHLFSVGYMSHDSGKARYFSYLNLFLASMLLLVLGENLVLTFIGWEGVGLCSYLLIGFWFTNPEYASAARKAFVMNRIGDVGFLVALAQIYAAQSGALVTFSYSALDLATSQGLLSFSALTVIACGFFVAAAGKSAQFPLYTWLPDAMAGPTPVSALIHAATMVTAGIYLTARARFAFDPALSPLFAAGTQSFVPGMIATVACLTAFLGAATAVCQYDIKKVLAYSTVSQLGFMFLAVGAGAPLIAVFHVVTHAFFKACLFLGSGSVIHACEGDQDMRKFGGLGKMLPITFITFGLATLALAGLWPFAGYYSKHLILGSLPGLQSKSCPELGQYLLWIATFAAGLTAFYMTRLMCLTFFGTYRGKHHPHEAPVSMLIPVSVLGVLSLAGGFLLEAPLLHYLGYAYHGHETSISELLLANLPALLGIALGFVIFREARASTGLVPLPPVLTKILENKFFLDELYAWFITNPLRGFASFFKRSFEPTLIEGGTLSFAYLVEMTGECLRKFGTGQLAHFSLWIFGTLATVLSIVFSG